jgi:hypothetical protein
MDLNDFKLYSVIIEGGSGVLFQPMNILDYTYVLTAKHNIFNKRPKADDSRFDEEYLLDKVNVYIQEQKGKPQKELQIIIGETYFPHETIDIAILKIGYIEGYQNIYANEDYRKLEGANICGYPGYLRNEKSSISEQYTSFIIGNFISINSATCLAQLTDERKGQVEISGLSGGGILKIENNHLSLFGIQIEVSSRMENGQIEFVPIMFFDDIINSPDNIDKLTPLYPPYIGRFELLKEDILKLESCIDPDFISVLREKFLLKVDEIELSPINIMSAPFSNQLLMHNVNKSAMISKKLWISWLEYLIVLHIIKDRSLSNDDLPDIFNTIRLIHTERNEDWQRFMSDIFRTDLYGLNDKGVLIVSSNKTPSNVLIEGNQMITNIANANPVGSFKTDIADIHPLEQFKFIHIRAFEKVCEENECELKNFTGLRIKELIKELKKLFDELLQN